VKNKVVPQGPAVLRNLSFTCRRQRSSIPSSIGDYLLSPALFDPNNKQPATIASFVVLTQLCEEQSCPTRSGRRVRSSKELATLFYFLLSPALFDPFVDRGLHCGSQFSRRVSQYNSSNIRNKNSRLSHGEETTLRTRSPIDQSNRNIVVPLHPSLCFHSTRSRQIRIQGCSGTVPRSSPIRQGTEHPHQYGGTHPHLVQSLAQRKKTIT
jgi:hypothetical protein